MEFWADAILRAGRVERREEAIAAAHATFGLLNSTPFSGRLDDQQMRALLHSMALSGLGPGGQDDARQPGNDSRPARIRSRTATPSRGDTQPRQPSRDSSNQPDAGGRTPASPGTVRPPRHREWSPRSSSTAPRRLNALSSAMAIQLAAACGELAGRPDVQRRGRSPRAVGAPFAWART